MFEEFKITGQSKVLSITSNCISILGVDGERSISQIHFERLGLPRLIVGSPDCLHGSGESIDQVISHDCSPFTMLYDSFFMVTLAQSGQWVNPI